MSKREMTAFGAGCFWGVQDAFEKVEGVIETTAGYCGGHCEDPNYKEVCSGLTGHAEVVLVTFDPDIVTYDQLLQTFFTIHDPTQVNRQGPDIGEQYRSVIFVTNSEQCHKALELIEDMQTENVYKKPIATEVEHMENFWPAEDYHQHYFKKHMGGSCQLSL